MQITRLLARQLHQVLRRLVYRSADAASLRLELDTSHEGLRVRIVTDSVAAEYHEAGSRPPERLWVPLQALADCAGRDPSPVTLEANGLHQVQVRWTDANVPQVRDYEVTDPESRPAFPARPNALVANGPELLSALAEAMQTAAPTAVRYALDKIQLCGRTGEIVGTDGHQALVLSGFQFPWTEDLLVTRIPVFGCKELPSAGTVGIGNTAGYVCIEVGPWTFFLVIDRQGRFPQVDSLLPKTTARGTTWRIAPNEASFLVRTLPRLPGQNDTNRPVTVDLNGAVVVRARSDGQTRLTEVALTQSTLQGQPLRFSTDRQYLARALQMGFTEVFLANADAPACCQDARRRYVWMTLAKNSALAPGEDVERIAVPAQEEPVAPVVARKQKGHKRSPVAQILPLSRNGHSRSHRSTAENPTTNGDSSTASGGSGNPIEEAQQLRSLLRDATHRAGQLVVALKKSKRHNQLLASTLASLRQLQNVAG